MDDMNTPSIEKCIVYARHLTVSKIKMPDCRVRRCWWNAWCSFHLWRWKICYTNIFRKS